MGMLLNQKSSPVMSMTRALHAPLVHSLGLLFGVPALLFHLLSTITVSLKYQLIAVVEGPAWPFTPVTYTCRDKRWASDLSSWNVTATFVAYYK